MLSFITELCEDLFAAVARVIEPIFLLAIRLWAANVFFQAGLLKFGNWSGTLYLFKNEYQVPFLPPEIAAYMGTGAELLLPPLLALGFLSRGVALALFVFNIMAVVSYPALWPNGFLDHQLWGLMLFVVFMFGPGKLSLDYWLKRKNSY